jgi:cytochrome c5
MCNIALEFVVLIRSFVALILLATLPLFAAEQKSGARSGEDIYRVYCGNCHGSGWQAAPIAYDEREWKERMAKGFDTMMANAKKGINAMPPMGTCMDCSDEELSEAIKEMLRF